MTHKKRRIDHLVLIVQDLDGAADFYRKLGFTVGSRNRHPWGTENYVIQLGSSFLELITVTAQDGISEHTPERFSFGAFVRDYQAQGEGLGMLVLDSDNAEVDAKHYAQSAIGSFEPFSFERKGTAADGSETHVAFSLAFAVDERLPNCSFFVCQQHFPEAFWSPKLQQHANGARNVASVRLAVELPEEHEKFLSAYSGVASTQNGMHYPLAEGGDIDVDVSAIVNGFTGYSVSVAKLGTVRQLLGSNGVPYIEDDGRIIIKSRQGYGAQIEFVRQKR
ncbi:VOC family protein [Glutamicibacter sp. JL.03c]|uniref:VOC family protein n=1 Tax=Glutamicibacter sp. JL.03c TaxID=2984842 RepID=UPI0021F75798|nr:VOC family protein [Glutamicibacter sp. JL.03c]UYQ77723.1 VOC family protein [Glutamicibacter sp. JL.03c]